MFAFVNGTRLFFDVEGVGVAVEENRLIEKPVCFVLHGGPGSNHLAYKNSLKSLSELVQLVYIDNRGSGYSDDSPKEFYHIEQNVDDLEALRQYLGLGKVVLLGQSYGGMVAMRYAEKYPDSIKTLLLITTSPHHAFINDAKDVLKEKGTKEQIEISEHVWEGSFKSEEQHVKFQELLAPMYAVTHDPNAPKTKRKGKYSFEALNQGFGGFLRTYDVTEGMRKLKIPALIIGARHDWITPVKHSYWLAELIPDNDLYILENSSHSVFKDEGDQTRDIMINFIKRRILENEEVSH